MALLLNRSDVQKLLPMSQAIDVVEAAFGELEAGTAEMPARTVFMTPWSDPRCGWGDSQNYGYVDLTGPPILRADPESGSG